MTTYFAKFMGNIKEIEITLEQTTTQFDNNHDNYLSIIKQLKTTLEQLSLQTDIQDAQKNAQLKHDFKNATQIYKKELEKPNTQLKSSLHKTQEQLNTISSKISDSEANKKMKLSSEELSKLHEYLTGLSTRLNTEIERLNNLLQELDVLDGQLQTTQIKLELCDYPKEEAKFIKNLEEFTGKLNKPEYIAIANRELLAIKLQDLLTISQPIAADETTNKPLLTQFENSNGSAAPIKPIAPAEPVQSKIATAKNSLKIN